MQRWMRADACDLCQFVGCFIVHQLRLYHMANGWMDARCAGVVHGDLKAANVLLTRGGEDVEGLWAANLGYRVTAKVADFGLALQLDPKDTHATMAARVGGRARGFGGY
jgi:serine/threonine protein kinase